MRCGISRTLSVAWLLFTILAVAGCRRAALPVRSVTIGSQVWMADNLDTGRYRNGDPVREAVTVAEWNDATRRGEGAWCRYPAERTRGQHAGRLYNWYAVRDPRGLAPKGWHIPEDREWAALEGFLGGREFAARRLGAISFNPLFGGSRNCLGSFFGVGTLGFFWTATPSGAFEAWDREVCAGAPALQRVAVGRGLGLSVRCVRD